MKRRTQSTTRARAESSQFAQVLDRRTLRRLAGAATFARGGDYVSGGKVRTLAEEPGSITAQVQGTDRYEVRLWLDDSELEYTCSCLVGRDGAFCKHCVAAGIAWLGRHAHDAGERVLKPSTTMDHVRDHLRGLGTDALVNLVTEQAQGDERLRRRLFMEAAKRTRTGPDVATYRASNRDKYGRRFRITHIMETLARRTGDVEAVVTVKKRDLSLPYAYLQIAETDRDAGKHDAALEWAERGMKAFP